MVSEAAGYDNHSEIFVHDSNRELQAQLINPVIMIVFAKGKIIDHNIMRKHPMTPIVTNATNSHRALFTHITCMPIN